MKALILKYFLNKYGAEILLADLLYQHLIAGGDAEKLLKKVVLENLEGFHVSKNPRKRICDEVMEARISA
jgi:hypothetical protein